MSIALMVRVDTLEKRVCALEAELSRARNAPMTEKPAPAKKCRRQRRPRKKIA